MSDSTDTPAPDSATLQTNPLPHAEKGTAALFAGVRIIALLTMLSRVFGLIRDMATAALFGLGPVMDAFALAFRVPNLFRRLFGEGAMSTAFLPVFTREFEAGGETGRARAWRLATAVFVSLTAVLCGIIVVIDAGLLVYAASQPAESTNRLLAGLTAVMLPYALLICLAAQVTAVLHALGHFTWPAAVPVVLNLCWTASVWIVDPLFEPDQVAQAYALSVGVLFAGVLQLVLQLPTLYRLGYRVDWNWAESRPALRSLFASVLPVVFGLSITQLASLQDSAIAWFLSGEHGGDGRLWPGGPAAPLQPGTVAAMYFGERMYQLPLGVFGIALGTVLFPEFARRAARDDIVGLNAAVHRGLRLTLLIGAPASAGLWLVADCTARLFFQRGEFTAMDADRTAGMIATYGLGVWAYCAIPILYRVFYACRKDAIPVRIGATCLLLDATLNLLLVWSLAERGLAASTAATAGVQTIWMLIRLRPLVGAIDWNGLGQTALISGASSAVMTVAYLAAEQGVLTFLGKRLAGDALAAVQLGVPLVIAGVLYAAMMHVLRVDEFWQLLRRGKSPPQSSIPS